MKGKASLVGRGVCDRSDGGVVPCAARTVASGPGTGSRQTTRHSRKCLDRGVRTAAPTSPVGVAYGLVVILAPLVIVDCGGGGGVVPVCIGRAGRQCIMVPVRIPVQTLTGPVEDSVNRQTGRGGCGEERRPGETVRVSRADDEVSIASQNAHVVAVLVERVPIVPGR